MNWLIFGWGAALLIVTWVADATVRAQQVVADEDEEDDSDSTEPADAPSTATIRRLEAKRYGTARRSAGALTRLFS